MYRHVTPIVFFSFACQGLSLDDHIRNIEGLPSDPPSVVEGETSAPYDDGDYHCVDRPYTETRAIDELVAFNANSESLWPGAIVRGDSVYSGLFTQLVFAREPLSFSISLENLAGAKSSEMAAPSLSQFRDRLGELLASEVTGATPANIYSVIESVESSEQLELALGASASWPGVSLGASFDFSNQTTRSRYLVKFIQSYYTVDVDQPGKPSDFFDPSVSVEDVEEVMFDGNPPLYVSSITYGRTVLFTFESEYSREELGAALNFVYKNGAEISGDVSLTHQEVLSSAKITAHILGGSGGDAAQSIGDYDALRNFISQGGDYSRDSPGAPIAYKLAYLRDNQPTRLSFTTDYSTRACERTSQTLAIVLESISVDEAGDGASNSLDLYGDILVSSGADQIQVLDIEREAFVEVEEGESYPTSGQLGEGVLRVTPQPGETVSFEVGLNDRDPAFGDEVICDNVEVAPFETGWRRELTVRCTGSQSEVRVLFSLSPI